VAATKNAARDIIENKENPMELTVTLANLYKMMEEAERNGARIIGRSLLMPGAPAPAPGQPPHPHPPPLANALPQQAAVQPQPQPPPPQPLPPPMARRPTMRSMAHKASKELAKLASFNKSPPQPPLPAKRVRTAYKRYMPEIDAIEVDMKLAAILDADRRRLARLDRVTKAFVHMSTCPHGTQCGTQ
jgi:hypothetical protein